MKSICLVLSLIFLYCSIEAQASEESEWIATLLTSQSVTKDKVLSAVLKSLNTRSDATSSIKTHVHKKHKKMKKKKKRKSLKPHKKRDESKLLNGLQSNQPLVKIQVPKTAYDFSGFSIGMLGGYSQMHSKTTEKLIDFSDATLQSLKISGQIIQGSQSARGVFVGGFLSVGKQRGHYYLGTELEGNFQNTVSKQLLVSSYNMYNITSHNLAISLKNNFALSVKAGVIVDKALIYVKTGAALGKFQVKSEYPYLAATSLGIGSKQYFNKYQTGIVFGVGVDVLVRQSIVFGGEIGYTQYQKFSINHADVSKVDITPSNLSFQIKAAYKLQ